MGLLGFDDTDEVLMTSTRADKLRLERELAKIDPEEEKQLAEEGLGDESWPQE